jgi:hypothetical protein
VGLETRTSSAEKLKPYPDHPQSTLHRDGTRGATRVRSGCTDLACFAYQVLV